MVVVQRVPANTVDIFFFEEPGAPRAHLPSPPGRSPDLPFIAVWDDHETANNAYKDGAQNHTPGVEGDWETRKAAGKQAYYEWMPIREQANGEVYRKLSYGDLLVENSKLPTQKIQPYRIPPAPFSEQRSANGCLKI